MAKDSTNNPQKAITMEELLASLDSKQALKVIRRGQEIEGEIISINDKEITLDLDAKSEGVLATREFSPDKRSSLKVGDKLKAFVYSTENEYGQILLSLEKRLSGEKGFPRGQRGKSKRSLDWSKFANSKLQKIKLKGVVREINRGGLIVEVSGTRGFLPNSQVGLALLTKAREGVDSLIGAELNLYVIEVDSENNKLIFSEKGLFTSEDFKGLTSFKSGQKAIGKISAVLPFGLVVSVKNEEGETCEGLIFVSDTSWEKIEDLSSKFSAGDEVEVMVTGVDKDFGRLNLSIKQLTEDPFGKLAEKYPVDEVVKGMVASVSDKGVVIKLEESVEGFLPASKMSPDEVYAEGKEVTMLVDSVDTQRRRVNLAPFVTSTAGLIYK